jgi:hypothetical protein
MKKFKDIIREFNEYPPTTADEKKFLKIHSTNVVDYPIKNKNGLPFRDDSIKAPGPQHNKRATYEPPQEPTTVYKSANEEVDIAEQANKDSSYPVTYEKGTMDQNHEVRHANLDLTKSPDYKSEGPYSDTSGRTRYPERTKKLVREHPLHKEMKDKGYRLKEYGTHGTSMFGKTYDTAGKLVKDAGKKKGVNEAFEKMDTESLKARHKRFSDSLMRSPNATNSSTSSHLDILDMHDELTKRGVRVEYPKHKLFDVERAADKRKASKVSKKMTQESLMNVDVDSGEIFESNDIMSLLAIISDTDNSAEVFFEGAEDSVVIDKELADMLLAAYAELDEDDQDDFEAMLSESEEDFGQCVDFAYNMLNE